MPQLREPLSSWFLAVYVDMLGLSVTFELHVPVCLNFPSALRSRILTGSNLMRLYRTLCRKHAAHLLLRAGLAIQGLKFLFPFLSGPWL